jgi:hypothetical protein
VIAQNGVQYSDGATGNVRDNVIADHEYTPKSFVAAALLIVNTNPNSVTRRENDYRNNEVNEYVCPAQNAGCSP